MRSMNNFNIWKKKTTYNLWMPRQVKQAAQSQQNSLHQSNSSVYVFNVCVTKIYDKWARSDWWVKLGEIMRDRQMLVRRDRLDCLGEHGVTGLPTGRAHQQQREGGKMVGDTQRKTTRNKGFSFPLCDNLARGGTHRLRARWPSWLACFVQKRQRPRQCRIRPYRNPHSLKPGPHPHSLQQSDTQPQPTALDTPGRGKQTCLR